MGPWIATHLDPGALRVLCRVNGETRQDGFTSAMIFDVPALIAYASRMMTLEPGDLLVTGTPEGVGPLVAGDTLEIEDGTLDVQRMDGRRVDRVRFTHTAMPEEHTAAQGGERS